MGALILSESLQTFVLTSNNRIAKVIKRYLTFPFNYYNGSETYRALSHLYSKMFTTDEINYLTFRMDGTLSYLPAGKEHEVTPAGEWSRKGRQNGKPGKVIRKIFTPLAQRLFKDHDFESFANQYKAFYNEGLKFDLLDNEDVPGVYRMRSGSFTSCMQGQDVEYFDIYKYCDDLKILTLKGDDNILRGRALVWTAKAEYHDEEYNLIEETVTFMDRVYCESAYMLEMFLDYSRDKKWWRKKEQNASCATEFVTADGKLIDAEMTVLLDTDHEMYPYIDTLSWGEDGCISNKYGTYCYDDTDGGRSGDDRFNEDEHDGEMYDDINDCWIDEDDASYIDMGEKAGLTTHEDDVVYINCYRYWVNDSGIQQLADGNYVLNEDAYFCEYEQDYYRYDDVVFSDYDDCYYHLDHVVESEQGWILSSDSVEIDGVIYHEDEAPEPEEEENESEEYEFAA